MYLYPRTSKLHYTVKKVIDIPIPSRDVSNQTLPEREQITVLPARESLVSGTPAGDGKIANLFLQYMCQWAIKLFLYHAGIYHLTYLGKD